MPSLVGAGAWVERALADVALAGVANLGWLSGVADRGTERPRHGNHLYGSFRVDFACRDGQQVTVVALTEPQWRAPREVTGTTAVFAALEAALDADLTQEADRYRLRETIAAILRPWFAARDFTVVSTELEGARVLWGRYTGMRDVVEAQRAGAPGARSHQSARRALRRSLPVRRCAGTASTASRVRHQRSGRTPPSCSPTCWDSTPRSAGWRRPGSSPPRADGRWPMSCSTTSATAMATRTTTSPQRPTSEGART
jgi:crotonobetainyl-CoA:carnitine CoA-transferase CaiB-like acyl-CoA transferase